MVNNVLRFLGAIAVAYVFSLMVDMIHITFFAGVAHFLGHLSWSSWFSLDIFRGLLLPIAWGILWLVGFGLSAIVRGSTPIALIPLIYFGISIIRDFNNLFLDPLEPIVEEIGLGFWYYAGATLTFVAIVVCYLICSITMLLKED